ncbi:MAG: amino acid ABC transporter permease [Promethearchaeota archaeon]
MNPDSVKMEIEEKNSNDRRVLLFFKNLRLTKNNFGWWLLFLLLFILFIGFISSLFNPDPHANYIDGLFLIVDLILAPFGTSLNMQDTRIVIIGRSLANGAVLTIIISLVSVILGFILAALLAVILVNRGKVYGLKYIAQAYVDFFRSTPLLVQILLVYFGMPRGVADLIRTIGIPGLTAEIFAGTLALSLNTAAYQAEIIRAGILAIPVGQSEAARALGLTSGQTMRFVILPQTIRMVVPPLTNEVINIILNSSLVSAIGVMELTKLSQSMQSYYFLWQVFFAAALYYFVIAFSLSKLTKRLEVKFRIPGLGVANE